MIDSVTMNLPLQSLHFLGNAFTNIKSCIISSIFAYKVKLMIKLKRCKLVSQMQLTIWYIDIHVTQCNPHSVNTISVLMISRHAMRINLPPFSNRLIHVSLSEPLSRLHVHYRKLCLNPFGCEIKRRFFVAN